MFMMLFLTHSINNNLIMTHQCLITLLNNAYYKDRNIND